MLKQLRWGLCVFVLLSGAALPMVSAQCSCTPNSSGGEDCVCTGGMGQNWNGTASDDSLDNQWTSTLGIVNGGGGDDTLTNSGTVEDYMDGGDGDDTLTNSFIVDGAMRGGDGDDTLINTGGVRKMNGGDGNDTLINDRLVVGDMVSGPGNDTLTNNDTVTGNMSGGAGDTLTNSGTVVGNMSGNTVDNSGTVVGNMYAGTGDTLTNSGTVEGDMSGFFGNNTLSNSGTVEGHMISEGGDDTLTNSGTVRGNMSGRGSGNTLINSGTVERSMIGENGADTLINSGTVSQDMHGQAGNDTLINSGTVVGYMAGGNGNDTVILQDGAQVGGKIRGGAGTDSLQFNMTVGAQYYEEVARQIMAANPNGGTITIGDNTYTWASFEELVNLLQMAMFHDGRLNAFDFAATTVVYCEAQGIHLYTAGGEFAFRVEAGTAQAAESGVVLGDALGVSLQGAGGGIVTAFGPDGYAFTFEARVCLP
jgi:Ca2+-binding RTX toxin-like protein